MSGDFWSYTVLDGSMETKSFHGWEAEKLEATGFATDNYAVSQPKRHTIRISHHRKSLKHISNSAMSCTPAERSTARLM
jgi:hypothetical protein